jgi:preprotein translocase subunit SecE
MVEKIIQFLKEVKIELRKVVWPTRKDTIASTSVVLVLVIIIAVFLGLVDLGLSRVIKLILD